MPTPWLVVLASGCRPDEPIRPDPYTFSPTGFSPVTSTTDSGSTSPATWSDYYGIVAEGTYSFRDLPDPAGWFTATICADDVAVRPHPRDRCQRSDQGVIVDYYCYYVYDPGALFAVVGTTYVPVAPRTEDYGWYATLETPATGTSLGMSTAGGADLAAFDEPDLVVVPEAVGVAPASPIPLDADLEVTWTGGGGDVIRVELYADLDHWVDCSFVDDGDATIPASKLAVLPAGPADFSVVRSVTGIADPGDFQVEVTAERIAGWSVQLVR